MKEQSLSRGLAFFSLGLGAAQLFAPRQVARLIGVSERHARTIQALGLREMASGLGIMQGKPAAFLWGRVAGDVMDLGLLGAAMRDNRSDRRKLNVAMGAVAAITVVDVVAAMLNGRTPAEPGWRIKEPEEYRSGLSDEDGASLRAHADSAMEQYQSGHVWQDEDELALEASPQPQT